MRTAKLRGFFALLEARGGGEIGARALDEVLARDGAEARSALRAAGVVRDAAPATTWPFPEAGCVREVKGRSATRFVAVCTRTGAGCEGWEGCEAVELGPADVAQATIVVDALLGAVADALRLEPVRGARGARRANEPWSLGKESTGARRDVVFLQDAPAERLRALVAERVAAGGGARVLVPTRRAVEAAAVASARVAIDALEDVIGVADKRLVELPAPAALRVVPAGHASSSPSPPAPAPEAAAPRCAALEGFPPIARWGDVTLFDVGEHGLVGVMVKGARRSRRLSCVDLALADKERRPRQAFELLQMICAGNGIFGTRRFGTPSNGKRILSELRAGLRSAFGLPGDPFERYSKREKSWKPKFRALEGPPDADRA